MTAKEARLLKTGIEDACSLLSKGLLIALHEHLHWLHKEVDELLDPDAPIQQLASESIRQQLLIIRNEIKALSMRFNHQ